MSDAKKGHKEAVTKKAFVQALVPALKEIGVSFVSPSGRKSQSTEKFWKLYTRIKQFEFAAAVAAGKDSHCSLSGAGTLTVAEVGPDNYRHSSYKNRPSSVFQDLLRPKTPAGYVDRKGVAPKNPRLEDGQLVQAARQSPPSSADEFAARVKKILDSVFPIDVSDEGDDAGSVIEIEPAI